MKRLINLLMALDCNVIMTAHGKVEYGEGLVKLGTTFDGFKKLDYVFDLVIELEKEKKTKKRVGRVVKTRLKQFPDGDVFPWSYDEFSKRYGAEVLEREAMTVQLASQQQITELKELLNVVKLDEGTTDKWLAKANVETWDDMPGETIQKCIDYVRGRLPGAATAKAKPAAAPTNDQDAKADWQAFIEKCESAAVGTGLPSEALHRGIKKVATALRLVGKEWDMPEANRADMLAAITKAEGHFAVPSAAAAVA